MDRYIVKVGENVGTEDEIWAELEFNMIDRHIVLPIKADSIGAHFWLDKMLVVIRQIAVHVDES